MTDTSREALIRHHRRIEDNSPWESLKAIAKDTADMLEADAQYRIICSDYANVQTNEAVRYQKRIRDLEKQVAQQVAVPDMFWNHDDADKLYSSISEFLNDEMCNGTELAVGDIRTVQRAVRLPNIDIRITSVNDDECDADYEIVEAQGAKP